MEFILRKWSQRRKNSASLLDYLETLCVILFPSLPPHPRPLIPSTSGTEVPVTLHELPTWSRYKAKSFYWPTKPGGPSCCLWDLVSLTSLSFFPSGQTASLLFLLPLLLVLPLSRCSFPRDSWAPTLLSNLLPGCHLPKRPLLTNSTENYNSHSYPWIKAGLPIPLTLLFSCTHYKLLTMFMIRLPRKIQGQGSCPFCTGES